ncbi:MAG TPA: DUF3800 domain-containing protein [Acetobacteraceae bacterium]|nr:DUF3800 domain-containing protein [Acetobacteraceae bacterium]
MAWFLFIDESGHDRRKAPYEVLAGVAVRDRDLWKLIIRLHQAEERHFGRRYSADRGELKGKKLLKTKVFQHRGLNCSVGDAEVTELAKTALDDGAGAGVRHLKALAMAKLAYVTEVFDLCAEFRCRAFASIVETDAPPTETAGLRKDYAYLFQRFYYFMQSQLDSEQGVIVFDELEKARSHLLIDQTHKYFRDTAVGRARAERIVPEPLFVHSDLTTGIQLADLVAYCVSWGFRTSQMSKPARAELEPYVKQIASLRYRAEVPVNGRSQPVWSFAHISDLRTRMERLGDEA